MTLTGVAVEKVHFLQNSQNLGDGKCLGKPRKSFVGLPIAKFFRAFSSECVFQQPQAISLMDLNVADVLCSVVDYCGLRVNLQQLRRRAQQVLSIFSADTVRCM